MPEVISDTSPIQYLQAKRQQVLPQVAPVIAKLIGLGFHLSASARDAVLLIAGEST